TTPCSASLRRALGACAGTVITSPALLTLLHVLRATPSGGIVPLPFRHAIAGSRLLAFSRTSPARRIAHDVQRDPGSGRRASVRPRRAQSDGRFPRPQVVSPRPLVRRPAHRLSAHPTFRPQPASTTCAVGAPRAPLVRSVVHTA